MMERMRLIKSQAQKHWRNRECLVSEDFVSLKRSKYAETESIIEKAVKKMFCSQSGKNTADESMIVKLIIVLGKKSRRRNKIS